MADLLDPRDLRPIITEFHLRSSGSLIWRLPDPREYLQSAIGQLAKDPLMAVRFDRFGAVDLEFDHAPTGRDVADIVDAMDPGRTLYEEATERETWEQWRTSIGTDPVIGPGGRLTYRLIGGVRRLSLLIRRREVSPVTGAWRNPDEIIDAVEDYLERWAGVVTEWRIGLYEAGRKTNQRAMKPAVLLTVENDPRRQDGPWRSVIVEPLVEAPGGEPLRAVVASGDLRRAVPDLGADGIIDRIE